MSDVGLRKELAQRLLAVRGRVAGSSQNIFGTEPFENEVAASQADECIRQMEWARRWTVEIVPLDPIPLAGKAVVLLDLTLAPKGWVP
jgi:hypothetical protein